MGKDIVFRYEGGTTGTSSAATTVDEGGWRVHQRRGHSHIHIRRSYYYITNMMIGMTMIRIFFWYNPIKEGTYPETPLLTSPPYSGHPLQRSQINVFMITISGIKRVGGII